MLQSETGPPDARGHQKRSSLLARGRRFGHSTCFLCGCRLGTRNRADEHIFPKWLLQRFDLWNRKLTLLNGTVICYRQLTIPCCRDCNTRHLAPIEDQVRKAVVKGVQAVRQLRKTVLFLWLGKILYGLLYREYLLKRDRKSKSKAPIVPREFLEQLEAHRQFLQGSRRNIEFLGFFPASIFIVRTQVPKRVEHQFDFRDAPLELALAIRMGEVGFIAALQDGGALRLVKGLPKFRKVPLHPVQFQEVAAQVFYKVSLLNRSSGFLMVGSEEGMKVFQPPLGGLSGNPIFDEWVPEHYARILSEFTRIPLERLYFPPGKVWTFLRDSDGRLLFIDVKTDPAFT